MWKLHALASCCHISVHEAFCVCRWRISSSRSCPPACFQLLSLNPRLCPWTQTPARSLYHQPQSSFLHPAQGLKQLPALSRIQPLGQQIWHRMLVKRHEQILLQAHRQLLSSVL